MLSEAQEAEMEFNRSMTPKMWLLDAIDSAIIHLSKARLLCAGGNFQRGDVSVLFATFARRLAEVDIALEGAGVPAVNVYDLMKERWRMGNEKTAREMREDKRKFPPITEVGNVIIEGPT